jgi:hypothetical protein
MPDSHVAFSPHEVINAHYHLRTVVKSFTRNDLIAIAIKQFFDKALLMHYCGPSVTAQERRGMSLLQDHTIPRVYHMRNLGFRG